MHEEASLFADLERLAKALLNMVKKDLMETPRRARRAMKKKQSLSSGLLLM